MVSTVKTSMPTVLKRSHNFQKNVFIGVFIKFLNIIFRRVGRPIKENEEVVLYASRFLSNMSDLVKEHLTTERGRTTLYNYIVWHSVKPLRMALSKGNLSKPNLA